MLIYANYVKISHLRRKMIFDLFELEKHYNGMCNDESIIAMFRNRKFIFMGE